MRKKSYVARARSFIRSFAPFLQDSDGAKALKAIRDYQDAEHRAVEIGFGSNRIAFIYKDFVVKIDRRCPALPTFGGCKEEMKMWQKAISDGASQWFAPIHRFSYMGRDWYIMPRAKLSFMGEDVRNWTDEVGDNQYYYYEKNIEDLHDGNVGTLNGRIVAIDYAALTAEAM